MTHVNIEPAHLKSIGSDCFQSSVKPFTIKCSHFFKQNILNTNHTHDVFHCVKKHLYFLLKHISEPVLSNFYFSKRELFFFHTSVCTVT